jgi:hypothetical protein
VVTAIRSKWISALPDGVHWRPQRFEFAEAS